MLFRSKVHLDWSNSPRRHQTLRNLDILLPLHLTTDDLSCKLGFTKEEIRSAKVTLSSLRSKHELLIGMHVGAGKIENRWATEKFAALANKLSEEHNAGFLFTAGPLDLEPLQQIRQRLRCSYTVIENQPIRQVAAAIDQLDLFISNDTGIMHVAGGTSTPTLSLFGPTDPLQWAPIGSKNRFISARDENINSITVEEVYNITDLILHELKRDL